MAGSRDQLVSAAKACDALKRSNYKGARCIGLHLEGPFIAPRYAGVHLASNIRNASLEEVMTLQRLSGGSIKMVTMAPEIPGVLEILGNLVAQNIICSIGHSDADFDTVKQAVDNGFRCVTHCYNRIRPFHHREPGAVGVALTDQRLTVELIVDEHHLHPNAVELAWRMKGPEKIVLVSDAMAPAGLIDGTYPSTIGELTLEGERLTDSLGRLAGSVVSLNQAVKNLLDYTGCELTDAFRTVTYNPAKLLGINKQKGSLYPGKDADIVALTPQFEVVMTMVEGEIISGLISVE
jgi:N-acetylglucosamine-6-phosphate deacetylase